MRFYKTLIAAIFLFSLLTFAFFNKKTDKFHVSAELLEEVVNQPLSITGNVPSWLSGTLIRNGPIKVSIDGQSNPHWFDGLAMLHAFTFQNGAVSYTNKFLRSDDYHTVFKEGSLSYGGFASDPCRSIFKQFLTFFIPNTHPAIHNANVNVAKLANEYVALTEIPLPVKFDPHTLDTLGVLNYQDHLPKEGCWESAHPHYDLNQKETINYLIKFGRNCYYIIYSIEDGESERKIIAEIPVDEPAYMHSFAVTQNMMILTEFPFVVKPLDLAMKGQAFIKNFTWQPERGTRFIVIDRHTGTVIGQYITKPFFAFHYANAFEKNGTVYLDIVTYKDASILTGKNLYLNANDVANEDSPSKLERFSLSLKTGEIASDVLFPKSNEFPKINENYDGLFYHYVYLSGFSDNATDINGESLYKVNTVTKEVLHWSEKGCSPGEPIFVAAPEAKEEDDGVVLTVIIDHIHNGSFLLILDGKTFQEIGRAKAPHLIPAGFHGQYFQ